MFFGFDPLATRRSRLLSFFLLYATEGIPQGLTSTAMAVQMKRQGLDAAEIGAFVAVLYLPWSWKWSMGPVVDLLYVRRWGRRRGWIVACQMLMVLTLLPALSLDYNVHLRWLTLLVLVHNVFAATQDVAIDALACATLKPAERGAANGLMFAGAYIGSAIGGSGVLLLAPYMGFNLTFLIVTGLLLSVTLSISLHIREPIQAETEDRPRAAVVSALTEYVKTALRAFFGTRQSRAGLLFALVPAGAYGLSLALSTNLSVELGLSDSEIGQLGLISTVLAASGCVAGGLLSDRLGRRKAIAMYIAATVVPTLYLAALMSRLGWEMPAANAEHKAAPAVLITAFWTVSLVFAFIQGLISGTRTALYMDICDPAVAATQFTAYMSLLNFVIFYSSLWQGRALAAWGYPTTLMLDAALGIVGLCFLPFMGSSARAPAAPKTGAIAAAPEAEG